MSFKCSQGALINLLLKYKGDNPDLVMDYNDVYLLYFCTEILNFVDKQSYRNYYLFCINSIKYRSHLKPVNNISLVSFE